MKTVRCNNATKEPANKLAFLFTRKILGMIPALLIFMPETTFQMRIDPIG